MEIASNRASLADGIEKELTCTVCLGKFVEPKVLPCLHTYCKKCLMDLVKANNLVVCPQCREEHVLPRGGADGLLTSFTFTNLVKLLEVHQAGDTKALTCENGLDKDPAEARCVDCQAYLCLNCCHMHKRMLATRQHNIVSLEKVKSTGEKCFQNPQHCSVHENEVLKLYCRTCSKTICGDCTYVEHRSHKYVFIKDVYEELRSALNDKVTSMRKLEAEAKERKDAAHKEVQNHELKVAAIRAEVDRTFHELTEYVKKCRISVHQSLDQQSQARKKIHSANVEEAELIHTRLTSAVAFIERLLQSSDACELTTMANCVLDQCKSLEAKPKKVPEKSCDWKIEEVDKSKRYLQSIAIKPVVHGEHSGVDLAKAKGRSHSQTHFRRTYEERRMPTTVQYYNDRRW